MSLPDTNADLIIGKIATRIIPLVMVGYLVAFLDRSNLAMAALTMGRDLELTPTQIGLGAGVFFIGYVLFEVPSNIALSRYGARIWLTRILLTWGLISVGTAWVASAGAFYAARFLLGVAEAGFVPGVIFYFTRWFPPAYRTRMFGVFIAANPLSGVIGNPVSGLILQLNGFWGLHGWQWIFVLEGIPAVLLGAIFYRRLPDSPAAADWLRQDERQWLQDALDKELRAVGTRSSRVDDLKGVLLNGKVLALTMAYVSIVCGSYGIVFWLPQIINGFGFDTLTTGFLAAVPWLCAAGGMICWTRRSDRTQERTWHLTAACLSGFAGLGLAAFASSPALSLLGLTVAAIGILSATATFWALPTALLHGRGLAAAVGFINAVGSVGGVIGPFLMGWLKDLTGSYAAGLVLLAASEVVAAIIVISLRRAFDHARAHSSTTNCA